MFVSDEDANLLRLNKNRLEKRTKRPHHIVCVCVYAVFGTMTRGAGMAVR